MKQRILYLSHVPWGWIKQRPHFIAEGLNKIYQVVFFYPMSYSPKKLVDNEENHIFKKQIYRLPNKLMDFNLFKLINRFLIKNQIQIKRDDILWFTHPFFFEYIEKKVKDNIVIYDCMDDCLAFPNINESEKQRLLEVEKLLCDRSDLIFVSSEVIKERLLARYKLKNKRVVVVNNGWHSDFKKTSLLPERIEKYFFRHSNEIICTYIGTISKWLDIEAVKYIADNLPNIKIILIGPEEETRKIESSNVYYIGPVEHKYLYSIMTKSDILIMPFKKNDLIEAVDPVKIYEYLASGKQVIARKYRETEKFKEFLFLYDDKDDLLDYFKNFSKHKALADKKVEIDNFLNNSTWEQRTKKILGEMKQYKKW